MPTTDTTDIAEALGDMAHVIDHSLGRANVVMVSGALFNEARDEILRLRKENAALKTNDDADSSVVERLLVMCDSLELAANGIVSSDTYAAGPYEARRLLMDAAAHVRGAAYQLTTGTYGGGVQHD